MPYIANINFVLTRRIMATNAADIERNLKLSRWLFLQKPACRVPDDMLRESRVARGLAVDWILELLIVEAELSDRRLYLDRKSVV